MLILRDYPLPPKLPTFPTRFARLSLCMFTPPRFNHFMLSCVVLIGWECDLYPIGRLCVVCFAQASLTRTPPMGTSVLDAALATRIVLIFIQHWHLRSWDRGQTCKHCLDTSCVLSALAARRVRSLSETSLITEPPTPPEHFSFRRFGAGEVRSVFCSPPIMSRVF